MANIAHILDLLLTVYLWVVFVRAILSWVRPNPYNPVVRLICRLVDPVTYWISRYIPARAGMMDFSPLILMVIILILQKYVVGALMSAALEVR